MVSCIDIFLAGYFIVARSDRRDVLPALPAGLSTDWPRQPGRERSSWYCNSAPCTHAYDHPRVHQRADLSSLCPSSHHARLSAGRPGEEEEPVGHGCAPSC
jgi:hypothetical protein